LSCQNLENFPSHCEKNCKSTTIKSGLFTPAFHPPRTLKNFEKNKREFVQPSGRILQSRAESQRIAAWELLYRVRHPGRYVSRLQTILHSDIALNDPRLEYDQHNANYRCEGSWFPNSYESGLAVVCEDHIHGPEHILPTIRGRVSASRQTKCKNIVASSRWDAALEAFRHNPADGSFAPPADRPSA
jgi:hypothetical protein